MNLIVNSCNKISGKISVGGDKSITHRSLILGAIANGKTEIINCSHAEDCLSTIKCLRAMGVEINVEKNKIIIAGRGLKGLKEPEDVLDCGNSGTTMRLLAGLVSGQNFYSVLTGDDSLRKRPMRRIIEPLKLMGARIESRRDNFAPLGISGNRLKGIEYKMPVASAQVKSSLMIAGLYADSKTIIEEPIRSRDHTERLFKFFGIKFKRKNNKITVLPAKGFSGKIIKIPNDISSAAFFLILGILIADKLTLKDTGINPLRIGIIQVLQDAGSKITLENQRKFCKETDRIRAIVTELKKFGANIKEIEDGLIIDGPTELIGTVCDSYKDHRIAMTLTIAGLIAKGRTIIKDIDCISISFPDFVNTLKEVCGEGYLQLDDTLFN